MRWPWNSVRGFKAESLANGNILVTPEWIDGYKGTGKGGGPGLFTRMRMALWIEGRLKKRGMAARSDE